MKLIAFLSASMAPAAWTIFAQAELTWIDPIVRLVTAGGFGALVWYLVVKQIPAIEKRHSDERSNQSDRFEKLASDYHSALLAASKAHAEVAGAIREFNRLVGSGRGDTR